MKRLFRLLGPLVVIGVFSAVAWLLYGKLKDFPYARFEQGLQQISSARVATAMALTGLYYLILVGYDLLAVHHLDHRLPLAKVALASFTGYACSYNFGPLLGGASVRYRLYSLWGLSPLSVAQVVVLVGLTFWVGVFTLGGLVFLIEPLSIPPALYLPMADTRMLGVLLLSVLAVYLGLCVARHGRPLRLFGRRLALPPARLGFVQAVVATADLLTGAGVLYVLIAPVAQIGYWPLLSIYLLSLAAGITAQVPGGMGVFELLVLELLHPAHPAELFAVLVVWRAIFYLLPLAAAGVVLGLHELRLVIDRRRRQEKTATSSLPPSSPPRE